MSFASQLKDVEDKIEAMERQLLLLKQHRNSLVPVCRLPPELLARVFSIVQHEDDPTDDPTDDSDFAFDSRASDWPRVMSVCTHFRAVAVQTPMLWNSHDFTRPVSTWRQLCLARAAGIPSCILISNGRGAEHLYRAWKAIVEEDNIRDTNHEVFDAIAAPHLRILAVTLYGDELSYLDINSSFLAGSLPLTTHFKLEGIEILLSKAPRMPSLRRLVLHEIQTHVNLEALVDLFEHSSMLEEISLRYISVVNNRQVLVDESAVTSVPKRVLLPHLKLLSIEDLPKEVAAFVQLLPMPSKALSIEVVDSEPADLEDLDPNHIIICKAYLSFVASHPESQELGIGSITVRHDDHLDSDTIRFGQNIQQNLHYPIDVAGFFTFEWKLRGGNMVFARISVLRVSWLPTSHNDEWRSYFLPKLDTLILESLKNDEIENEQFIKSWLLQQEGRIKRVQFDHCSPRFVRLSEELEREQVVSQVIWNC
jgi:hypothetical protein